MRKNKNILLWKLILILAIFITIVILLEVKLISKKTEKDFYLSVPNLLKSGNELNEKVSMPEKANVDYRFDAWISFGGKDWVRMGYQISIPVYENTNYYFNSNDVENRYYVKISDIENTFSIFGFKNNQDIVGKNVFVTNKTKVENYKLYPSSGIVSVEGVNYLPLNTVEEAGKDNTIDIYYFPNNTLTESEGPILIYDEKFIKNESFYTVAIFDNNGSILEETYIPVGQTYRKELDSMYIWEMIDNYTGIKSEIKDNVVEIKNINHSYNIFRIIDENNYYITYDVNNQNNINVQGKETSNFVDKIPLDNIFQYDVLDLTAHEYIKSDGKWKSMYEFGGWIVNDNEKNIVQPGEKISQNLINQIGKNTIIKLKAKWDKVSSDELVNFYVNLTTIYNEDKDEDMKIDTESKYFTNSQYVAKLKEYPEYIFEYLKINESSKYFEYFPNIQQYMTRGLYNETSKYSEEINTKIRNLATEGFEIGENSSLKISSFPSDEEIFSSIRNDSNDYKIHLNGKEVDIDYLTTDNFYIDWYVFKYVGNSSIEQWSDAWHIDGRIIFKENKDENGGSQDEIDKPIQKPDTPDIKEDPVQNTDTKVDQIEKEEPQTVPVSGTEVNSQEVVENNKLLSSIIPDTGMGIIPIVICFVTGVILMTSGKILKRKPKRKLHKY